MLKLLICALLLAAPTCASTSTRRRSRPAQNTGPCTHIDTSHFDTVNNLMQSVFNGNIFNGPMMQCGLCLLDHQSFTNFEDRLMNCGFRPDPDQDDPCKFEKEIAANGDYSKEYCYIFKEESDECLQAFCDAGGSDICHAICSPAGHEYEGNTVGTQVKQYEWQCDPWEQCVYQYGWTRQRKVHCFDGRMTVNDDLCKQHGAMPNAYQCGRPPAGTDPSAIPKKTEQCCPQYGERPAAEFFTWEAAMNQCECIHGKPVQKSHCVCKGPQANNPNCCPGGDPARSMQPDEVCRMAGLAKPTNYTQCDPRSMHTMLDCKPPAPPTLRPSLQATRPPVRYKWVIKEWASCSAERCDQVMRHRSVKCSAEGDQSCQASDAACVADQLCASIPKPPSSEPCPYTWVPSPWQASVTCSTPGVPVPSKRKVQCLRSDGQPADGCVVVDASGKPCKPSETSMEDMLRPCPVYQWRTAEWSPCTLSCGGGQQSRIVNCAVYNIAQESFIPVPDDQCLSLDPKPSSTRICLNVQPCTRYMWEVISWKACDVECGEGRKEPILRCMLHDGVNPKPFGVNHENCDAKLKPVSEVCQATPRECSWYKQYEWRPMSWSQCSGGCNMPGTRQREIKCFIITTPQGSTSEVNPVDKCLNQYKELSFLPKPITREDCIGTCVSTPGPTTSRPASAPMTSAPMTATPVQYSPSPSIDLPAWVVGEWSAECSTTCGIGHQTRTVGCAVRGAFVREEWRCSESKPPTTNLCPHLPKCETWQTEPWSSCSTTCDSGYQQRRVFCGVADSRNEKADALCEAQGFKPSSIKTCSTSQPCPIPTKWDTTAWGRCSVTCGTAGVQTRIVQCVDDGGRPRVNSDCRTIMPDVTRPCEDVVRCEPPRWHLSEWRECSTTCGNGMQARDVDCRDESGKQVADLECSREAERPTNAQPCVVQSCNAPSRWETSDWSRCPVTCGQGTQRRSVSCISTFDTKLAESACEVLSPKPPVTRYCDDPKPLACETVHWETTDWGPCSRSCDSGVQTRIVECHNQNGTIVDASKCDLLAGQQRPERTMTCTRPACPPPPSSVPTAHLQNASDPIAHTATSATIRVSLDAELSDFTEERVLQLKRDIAKVSGSPIESIQVQLQPGSVIAVVTMPRLAVDKMADAVEKGEVGQLGGSLVLAVSGDGELFGRLQISFAWLPTDWAACSVTCGTGIQVREIRCESNSGQLAVDSGQCRGGKPGMSKECTVGLACEVYMWKPSAFGPCSATCGAGNAHRLVECYDARNFLVPNDRCPQPPPSTTRPCEQACASSTILPTGAIVSRAITAIEPLPDVNDGSSTDSSSSILLYILIVVGILVALLLGLVVYCLMKNNKEAAKRTQAEQQLQIQMSSMRLQQAVASPIDSPGSLRDPALQISPYATAGNHSSACEQALPASGDLETNEASLAEVAVSVETATALPVAVAVQLDL